MGTNTINDANKTKYVRRVIQAEDLSKPADIVPFETLYRERLPNSSDPGPYKLGIGDVLSVSLLAQARKRNFKENITSDEGTIKLLVWVK